MSKDISYTRYFKIEKSLPKKGTGIHQMQKLPSRLIWDSKYNGTYVKSIHGILT